MDTNPTNPEGQSGLPSDLPKKFIRTFEEDIETLRKGGTPDLTPFPPAPAPAKPQMAKPPAPPAPPTPPPAPIKEEKIPKSPVLPRQEDIREHSPLLPPTPLETYSGDFSNRIKKTHASAATVLAAEQDAHQGAPEIDVPEKSSPRSLLYGIGGGLLCIAGGIGLYVAYTNYVTTRPPDVPVQSVIPTPISIDEQIELVGSGTELFKAFSESIKTDMASGAVRLVYTQSSIAPASSSPESVFVALRTEAPPVLLRNIQAGESMAGVINILGEQSPFFILSVSSYKETFAGMLAWEPRMRQDLQMLFPPFPLPVLPPLPTTATTSIRQPPQATSSSPAPRALVLPTFSDTVVANHDVRLYRDSSGNTILVYGYWSPTTLVIARNQAAFSEILQRLSTARAQL